MLSTGKISYYEKGISNETIICLHGIGGDYESFEPQVNGLSDKYRIISWNMPGYRDSKPLEKYSFENLSIALNEFLINLTRCNIPYPDIYEMLGYNLSVPARICRVLLERVADNDAIITKLKIPTLITHGDDDTSVLLSMAHHNHSLIKNSVLSIYKKTGHAPFYEDPHRFSEELQEFTKHCYNT